MTTELESAVRNNPVWYHTLDLGNGLVTPGWFDLRPITEKMPWPDVRGKRCLDVGTYDGFLAFELERRGAADVVATDISDHDQWDWPVDVRAKGPDVLASMAGPEKSAGFRIAKRALGSNVEHVEINIYDLSPERLGTFDVVVCGSLMLHLRDPLRALAAIRSVTGGVFLSAETIDLPLTIAHPRRPVSVLNGMGGLVHWTIPNMAGHRRMVQASGFKIERATRPYTIPFGAGHPERPKSLRTTSRFMLQRAVAGGPGVPHAAVLGRAI